MVDGRVKRWKIDYYRYFVHENRLARQSPGGWENSARSQNQSDCRICFVIFPCSQTEQRRLALHLTALWVYISMCLSSQDLSCCSDLCKGDQRSIKIGISFSFSLYLLNTECYRYSASQFFNQDHLTKLMIDQDYKKVGFFVESHSEDQATRDRLIPPTQLDICTYFLHISCYYVAFIDTWIIVLPK